MLVEWTVSGIPLRGPPVCLLPHVAELILQ